MSENINATLRFMPLANGKFTWKIYDDNGSVVNKAGIEFASEDAAREHFNNWQAENSEEITNADPADEVTTETAPVETAPETVTAPETPETTEAAEVAPVETTDAAPVVTTDADAAGQPVEQAPQEGAAAGSVETAGNASL